MSNKHHNQAIKQFQRTIKSIVTQAFLRLLPFLQSFRIARAIEALHMMSDLIRVHCTDFSSGRCYTDITWWYIKDSRKRRG